MHAHYGKSHILHGIDLAIGRGEVISLLGRNGAGRSTTMKSIMGLVDVTGGQIHIEGRDITNKRPFEIARAGLGFVPEEREVFANLTVDENLRMGEQPRRADAVLDRRADVRLLPAPEGTARHPRRQPVGRRAADADHVPLAAGQSRSC